MAHGGGKRCMQGGCSKGAEGGTQRCKGHGGGRRCRHEGCFKSAQGGGTQHCIAHGGGKRCQHADCSKPPRARAPGSAYCGTCPQLDDAQEAAPQQPGESQAMGVLLEFAREHENRRRVESAGKPTVKEPE